MAEAAAAKKAPETKKTENPAEAKKSSIDLLGLIAIIVVTVNLIGVGVMGFFGQKMWAKIHELQGETQKLATKNNNEEVNLGSELTPQNLGALYPIESFLVNIASDQGPKFLQTQMELELADPGVEDELARKKAAIRDAIIVLLSSRSYRELRDAQGMKKLRIDVLRTINNLLSTGKVKEIYFTQFHFN